MVTLENNKEVQSPPKLDKHGENRANDLCNVIRTVKIVEYKVCICNLSKLANNKHI